MTTDCARAGGAADLDADRVRAVLREVLHPDAGLDIIDLGLVYDVDVHGRDVRIRMTLMQRDNPSRGLLLDEIENCIRARFRSVRTVAIDLVWDPPWQPGMAADDPSAHAAGQSAVKR